MCYWQASSESKILSLLWYYGLLPVKGVSNHVMGMRKPRRGPQEEIENYHQHPPIPCQAREGSMRFSCLVQIEA